MLILELSDRVVTTITARQLVEDASIRQDRIQNKIEILDRIKAREPQEYSKPSSALRSITAAKAKAGSGEVMFQMALKRACAAVGPIAGLSGQIYFRA